MAKHKTKQYRRNQRRLHIEQKKRIIQNRWYEDSETTEWNEEHVIPTEGKLAKGNVNDCMKHVDKFDSFHEYTISDRKCAASMLESVRECELAGIDGALKSDLSRIVRNSWKYKNKGYTHYQKGKFSYEEFQLLLSERGKNERQFRFRKDGHESETAFERWRAVINRTINRKLRLSA